MKKKKRRDGRLSKSTGMKQPNHLFFFDTETTSKYIKDNVKMQVLRLGVCQYISRTNKGKISSAHEIIFKDTKTLVDFIFSKIHAKKKAYIFAHNAGFDVMVTMLPSYFKELGYEVKPFIKNGMVFVWTIKTDRGTLTFINTGNYTPYKLSKLAKDLGMEKLEVDFDTEDEYELIHYCRNDVLIIQTFVMKYIRFLEDNKLGSFKVTLASQALSAYTTRFNTNLPYTHTNDEILNLEKKAYKGGRTEPFKIGTYNQEDIFYTDINSMYPYCMMNENLPKRFILFEHNMSLDQFERISKHRYCIADVTINTDLPFSPLIYNPNEHRILNHDKEISQAKLLFPVGEFRTQLHHDELIYALYNGFIQKLHTVAIYERGDIFSDYVNFFSTLKINATMNDNETDRLLAKIFLNALYGKFGQQYKWFEKIEETPTDNLYPDLVVNLNTKQEHKEFIWFGERWGNFTKGWVNHSIPALAGAITASARMLLWDYMYTIGKNNLYYTDTDSLITNAKGYSHLQKYISSTELGKLKLEQKASSITINGCKDYIIDGKRVLKGVPKSAIEIEPRTFQYEHFEGTNQWQRRGMDTPPLITTMIKKKRTPYDKAIVNDDGTTTPYEIVNR